MQKLQNNATPMPFKATKWSSVSSIPVNWSFLQNDLKSEDRDDLEGDKLHEKWDLLFDDFDDLRLK